MRSPNILIFRDCSIATGADSKIARQEQGESTWDPLNASELAPNSANGLIPSLIAWAKSQPPGNVAIVSIFMRMPSDIATALYHTGLDPFTGEEVYVAKGLRDRKMQRALMQFFKPENYFMAGEALLKAGRQDLIGGGCDCLIPAHPPREAIEARRRRANEAASGDNYHSVANPAKGEPVGERGLPNQGYRPGRKTARRQDKKRQRKGGSR